MQIYLKEKPWNELMLQRFLDPNCLEKTFWDLVSHQCYISNYKWSKVITEIGSMISMILILDVCKMQKWGIPCQGSLKLSRSGNIWHHWIICKEALKVHCLTVEITKLCCNTESLEWWEWPNNGTPGNEMYRYTW